MSGQRKTVPLQDYLGKNNKPKMASNNNRIAASASSSTDSTTMSSTSTADREKQNQLLKSASGHLREQFGYAKDDADAVDKIVTLESIDRLSRHIPNIVIDHILDTIREEKEKSAAEHYQQQQGNNGGPPGFMMGNNNNGEGQMMTLEVPMSVTTDGGAASAMMNNNSGHSVGSGGSLGSGRNMNDLLNTLESLDELLDEEFSSHSREEQDEDDDDDSDDDDSDNGMDASGNSFEDDSVSDIDDDEALVDDSERVAGDGKEDNDDDDGEEDSSDSSSGESDASYSDLAAAMSQMLPPSRAGSEHGGSGHYSPMPPSRGRSPMPSRGHSPLPSRNSSGHGLLRNASGHSKSRGKSPFPSMQEEVGKLKQGRLVSRRQDQIDAVSDERSFAGNSQTGDHSILTNSTGMGGGTIGTKEAPRTEQISCILFLDISGFTKLSRSLEVEPLSKIINGYFQSILNEIKLFGGDVLKFAGDALIVEWTQEQMPQPNLPVVHLAALCASKLVDKCSDFAVKNPQGEQIATLNLHGAIGYGNVVGVHCGDLDRQEYLILGDCIRQIADGMDLAELGEIVASPEAMEVLKKTVQFKDSDSTKAHPTLAFKGDQKFQPKTTFAIPDFTRPPVSSQCHEWSLDELENLQRQMSRYVHSVVYSDEFAVEDSNNRNALSKKKQTQSELRDVFTVFIQPNMKVDLNAEENCRDSDTLELLNSILFIVNSEVNHFKAHLRQFIVDDKGLVIIANFGLRGSTYPNMIEERAIPCIANIKTLLKTELDLECKMGATFGKAYCGVVGGKARHEYAILGPSVNLAARLMASTSNQGILVDEEVKMKSGERPFLALPPVKAKGYDHLVKIYSPEENVRKAWKNVSQEFVGRQEEVEGLLSWAESVCYEKDRSKAVFVSGPYGIGKSYVLSQAAEEIEKYTKKQGQPFHISRHVFCEEDSFQPFSIVRPLFLDLLRRKQYVPSFGGTDKAGIGNDVDQTTELEEAQLYVSLLQICLEAKIPMQYIEMFGGLIFSTKLSDIGTWSDKNQKMTEWNDIARFLVTAFIHCTANYNMVLLALDDVSGMDEMSWKILQKLYERSTNILMITTSRNEFDLNINPDFWEDLNDAGIEEGRFRHLRMSPMDENDVTQLACKRLSMTMADIDETIGHTVHRQSRGNPLLACEILDVMYKENESDADAEVSAARETKIEQLLLNRLDELSPAVRSHLNLGAILGLTFHEEDIVHVMEKYNDIEEESKASYAESVQASLQESVQYGILKCTDGYTYSFSHPLWMKTIALHLLDDWKEEMRSLISNDEERAMIDSVSNFDYEYEEKEEDIQAVIDSVSNFDYEERKEEMQPFSLNAGSNSEERKPELRSLLSVACTDADSFAIKYDWDELASIRTNLRSMREQNSAIQRSINELRALIQGGR